MLLTAIGWILFGVIAGALGRWLMPGPQPMGFLATCCLGIAGSFVGGFLSSLLFGGELVQSSGWIGSILGVVLVLAVAGRWNRQQAANRLTH